MAHFERIMATITAGLLLALVVLTAAHFFGVRVDPPREREGIVIVGPPTPAVDPAEVRAAGGEASVVPDV